MRPVRGRGPVVSLVPRSTTGYRLATLPVDAGLGPNHLAKRFGNAVLEVKLCFRETSSRGLGDAKCFLLFRS